MDPLRKLTTSENRIECLHSMHLYTLEDVIHHFPYRYEEIEEIWPAIDEKVIVEGIVAGAPRLFFKGRFSRLTVPVLIKEEEYQVTIFNRHFLKAQLITGKTITVMGKISGRKITASNIVLKPLSEQKGIHPVYSIKEGITNKAFSQYVEKALKLVDHIDDFVPVEAISKYNFIDKMTALRDVHFPKNREDVTRGLRRLKYEEFLKFQLTMQFIKMSREEEAGIGKIFDINDVKDKIHTLPFKLTSDQVKAVKDILDDLSQPTMMYRFLQGDVGSGKTVVGAIALYANALSGYQGAMMAPTEVLAKQHFTTLCNFFKDTDFTVGLLVGSLSQKDKDEIYSRIENGEIDIIVGTHALFQEKVVYHNLGFVITDEQHRFGVEQRKALKNKGSSVDFLVMSATPIPRTLALALYGDMDVSTIQTKPAGRQETVTKYFKGKSMKPFLRHLKAYLAQGGQCYVICPLIEDNEDLDLKSATQIASAMSQYFKGQYRVGLLHGSLKEDEKDDIMNAFKENKIQILVSTTVIEVGIDVRNANMMVIYDAERFGMSQIHQLRGRIGRGSEKGYCFLLSAATNEEAISRLRFLESHHDGFEISEYDLKMRGPGEVLGERQSGLPMFMFGDVFRDMDILEITRKDALKMIEDHYKYGEYEEYIEAVKEKIQSGNEYVD